MICTCIHQIVSTSITLVTDWPLYRKTKDISCQLNWLISPWRDSRSMRSGCGEEELAGGDGEHQSEDGRVFQAMWSSCHHHHCKHQQTLGPKRFERQPSETSVTLLMLRSEVKEQGRLPTWVFEEGGIKRMKEKPAWSFTHFPIAKNYSSTFCIEGQRFKTAWETGRCELTLSCFLHWKTSRRGGWGGRKKWNGGGRGWRNAFVCLVPLPTSAKQSQKSQQTRQVCEKVVKGEIVVWWEKKGKQPCSASTALPPPFQPQSAEVRRVIYWEPSHHPHSINPLQC